MKTLITATVLGLIATILLGGLTVAGQKASNPGQQASKSESDRDRSGESIKWQVIASGGTKSSSQNFSLGGTVGQTAVGQSASQNYGASHGFWQTFVVGPDYICGDANGSGGDPAVDIDDIVFLISYIFSGGPAPVPLDAGDVNCSGGDPAVDIDDVVYLINYVFAGGPAPCDPDDNGAPDC